jgi:hypothetical protein
MTSSQAALARTLPNVMPFRDYLNQGYVGDHTSLATTCTTFTQSRVRLRRAPACKQRGADMFNWVTQRQRKGISPASSHLGCANTTSNAL